MRGCLSTFTAAWSILLIVLMLLLAAALTPTGGWWDFSKDIVERWLKEVGGEPAEIANLWLSGVGGLIGAGFSIALAVRRRTVALDTNWPANAEDALLRLIIGMISGGGLVLLLSSGILPKLMIGDASTVFWS